MIRHQRRIDNRRRSPCTHHTQIPRDSSNIYRQDLAFDRTANCRHDGRFHCDCGYSTSRQYRSFSHATHNAPTPLAGKSSMISFHKTDKLTNWKAEPKAQKKERKKNQLCLLWETKRERDLKGYNGVWMVSRRLVTSPFLYVEIQMKIYLTYQINLYLFL